jgi:FAD/FMN-containing dehydrogenase
MGSTQSSQRPVPLDTLRAEFDGRVIAPGDPGYDWARAVFNGAIDRRPAVIIRPADPAGVARVVTLARETGLDLAVRSGGHGGAGHGVCDGGIVLDLSGLRALRVDPERRTAWAETGLTAGEYTTTVGAHGLATGFGDTGSVGLGGLTLGGGVGLLARKHGLTIDHLLAADVVTADGDLLRVDAEHHPDLFWAIRGGGGNFGVATAFQFRLHEVGTVVGGMLMLPATPEVVRAVVAEAEAAPVELTTIVNVMSAPPMPFVPTEHHGALVVMVLLCHVGPVEAGERAVAPFRALATPIVDLVRPMSYPELFPPAEPDYRPTAAGQTLFMDGVDQPVAEAVVAHLGRSDSPMRAFQLRVLGGAVSQVPADATAYAHRGRRILANVAALYRGPEDRAAQEAWVAEGVAALRQGAPGAFVNFLADEDSARVRDAYPGTTWDRLTAVKRRYDPANLFRLNQNIPPAAEDA